MGRYGLLTERKHHPPLANSMQTIVLALRFHEAESSGILVRDATTLKQYDIRWFEVHGFYDTKVRVKSDDQTPWQWHDTIIRHQLVLGAGISQHQRHGKILFIHLFILEVQNGCQKST